MAPYGHLNAPPDGDAPSTAVPQLNNKHVLPYVLRRPGLEEQRRIAAIISTWDQGVSALSTHDGIVSPAYTVVRPRPKLIDAQFAAYQPFSTEYKRLPGLHEALLGIFAGVQNPQDREQCRQVLMPRHAEDSDGQTYDTRQKVRDDFYRALTAFGLCLQTALSSRSFFDDHRFSEADVERYKADLRFFNSLRQTARQDALETVDYGVYEAQIRRLVDQQVIGTQVREPQGVYLVHRLGQPEAAESWSEDKTRNETDLIRTRLKKTIEQDLADDPYAQQVFADLLKQAIAEAEAMFDHPLKQYALFRTFEAQVQARDVADLPATLSGDGHIRAYFGICRLVLGDAAFARTDEATWVAQAQAIDAAVRQAVAEHSLNPQNIEAAVRQALLPGLFALMGLDKAKEAIDQVIQVTRVGLARGGV